MDTNFKNSGGDEIEEIKIGRTDTMKIILKLLLKRLQLEDTKLSMLSISVFHIFYAIGLIVCFLPGPSS